jgi:DNA-binding MarR family transcriptional regulator
MSDKNKINYTGLMQETLDLFWQTIPPLWHATRTLTHLVAVDELKITPSQFHTLRRIPTGKGSVSDLADCMNLSRPNVSRTVDELVQNSLVQRKRDPDDRRNVILSLTPKGISLIKTLHEKIGERMIERFTILDEGEINELRRGLYALQKIFGRQENPHKEP